MIENEAARLDTLRSYRILDTDPEQAFDDLTLLASQICEAPIALISLVDENRQWFKSRVGIEAHETSRSVSFCAHAIAQRDLFIVPDASNDDRFRDNPLVRGEPLIRFYAGAPLVARDGQALGTLCVVDRRPRVLTADQQAALAALRRQAQAQLELRRNLDELRIALEGLDTLGALLPYCSTCDLDIVIPAEFSAMAKVHSGVNALLVARQWPDDEAMKVELALQEALANAIRHGCRNDPTQRVQCCVSFGAGGELVIVIRDPGPGFDVNAVPSPLEDDNRLKPGGRGVFLINRLMDEVEYADRGRQVTMRKTPIENRGAAGRTRNA